MNPKRKPFIWLSGLFAFLLFVLSAVVLGVALNNTLSKLRRIVPPLVDSWQIILWKMVFLGLFSAILALYTLWSVMRARKKSKCTAIAILLAHCLALGAAIYLVLSLDKLHAAPPKSKSDLFSLVNQLIKEGRRGDKNLRFVPPWLDHIQKSDAQCCGIMTYRDWETFWSPLENTYPKSCCRPSKINCSTSGRDIVYPDLLGNNIKTDGGCYLTIVSRVKAIILESKKFCSILTVGIGMSLATVAVLYLIVFYLKKASPTGQDDDEDSDIDDPEVPKFPPDQLNWRNLEFYRVMVKRKPKKVKMLPPDGSASADPFQVSTTFEPSSGQMDQQQTQPAANVEYRVDVLSPSTVQVTNDSPQQPMTQGTVGAAPETVVAVTSTGFSSDTTDDGQDRRNGPPQRKRLHRHRHRRDFQENEVLDNTAPQS